jgi:TRAP-type C4-dicarboxylate transport system permease small subunit
MQNAPKQSSKETYIVIGIFVLMFFLNILIKSFSHNASTVNAGIGIIFQPRFWMMSLVLVAYGVAFIAEVLFLISFLTHKRISPYLAIALGLGVCILSYVVIS